VSIARGVHRRLPPSFDLGDLIGVGNAALVRKASVYDPRAHGGTPFSAFARQGIRGAIVESVRRNKYIENTRDSIDNPASAIAQTHADSPGGDLRFETDTARALARMATPPHVETSIDRTRLLRSISRAIAYLPPQHRALLCIWYGRDEPGTQEVARRMGLALTDVKALHGLAIAELRALVNQTARPRAEQPKAA
jgi:RNA polymerase sigma factor (sigma-70 family)